MTLDPVSRFSTLHWLPGLAQPEKPAGVRLWFHCHAASCGLACDAAYAEERVLATGDDAAMAALEARRAGTRWLNAGNFIAAAGGHWGPQRHADLDLCLAGNHGHVRDMIERINRHEDWQAFLAKL